MDSIDLARHLIALSEEQNKLLIDSNTKLNKLLYIIYGIYIAVTGNSILTEKSKCFPYGSIFPIVFTKYRDGKLKPLKLDINDEILKEAINTTIENFGDWSASKLSAWSHQKDSPWEKVYNDNENNYNKPLNDNDIKEYFNNIIEVIK